MRRREPRQRSCRRLEAVTWLGGCSFAPRSNVGKPEDAMSIIRLIHITIDPSEIENALQVWKKECAPLMIQQKGCISEKLLRCREAHELISYSEWATEADIELYRSSDAHKEIVRHARSLRGSKAEVKLYDLVE
jgi:heme-degrading monooxygenase HmoA